MQINYLKKIYLKSAECLKLSEKNDDELYVIVMAFDITGELKREMRFPKETVWKFLENERKILDQLIYTHDEPNIEIVSITFMEEDTPEFSRFVFDKIRKLTHHLLPDILDQRLGVLYVKLKGNELVSWTAGQNCYELETAPSEPIKSFVLTIPNKYQYSVVFEVETEEVVVP